MKSSTLRTIIIGATILIVLVMGAQLYWLKKTYALEEKAFNVKVHSALRSVEETIRFSRKDNLPFAEVISQPGPNYFMARMKYPADSNEVEFLLKKAFEEYNVFTSFRYGMYNTSTGQMEHVRYITSAETSGRYANVDLPLIKRPYNYIGVLFPNRRSFIIHEMDFWIYSTLLLLVVIMGFAIAIFKLFRQKQLSEIQKDFINNMTHEFRTPISTIQLSTEVLKNNQGIRSDHRLFQYTNIIENEVNHLENQVDRVLQVAKMEKHALQLDNESVNMHEIITQTVHDLGSAIQQKGGAFRLELNATRPVISADRLHFINILFNLVDNAIKYSPQPQVTISTSDLAHGVSLSVADNGIGIPMKYQKFLFTKFFRVPTGNLHEVKGFGLGLNYVKLYIRALNGEIDMKSEPGKGSNFTLRFPDSTGT